MAEDRENIGSAEYIQSLGAGNPLLGILLQPEKGFFKSRSCDGFLFAVCEEFPAFNGIGKGEALGCVESLSLMRADNIPQIFGCDHGRTAFLIFLFPSIYCVDYNGFCMVLQGNEVKIEKDKRREWQYVTKN